MTDTLPHQREHYQTIVDALVAGVDHVDVDIDDEVDAWHDGEDQSHGSLSSHLGMTEEEYARWAMDPDAILDIVEKRKAALDGPKEGPLVTRFGIGSHDQVTSFQNATLTGLDSGHAMSVALTPPSDFPAGHPTIARGLLEAAFRKLVDLGWKIEIEIGPDLGAG